MNFVHSEGGMNYVLGGRGGVYCVKRGEGEWKGECGMYRRREETDVLCKWVEGRSVLCPNG